MIKHFDLAILGGGCAGLSLAMRLAEHGKLTPSTIILEKRAEYLNDRTWCFWDEGEPALKDWADHAWQSFEIKNGSNQMTKSCESNAYVMLSAKTFYERAIAAITLNAQRINILKSQAILDVVKTHNQLWRITTADAIYTATKIVDTRPMNNINDADSVLWQSFTGDEIETSANIFDSNKFVLMDFDATFNEGLGFIYVLPYSSNRALIEYTVFSDKLIAKDHLKARLEIASKVYLKGCDYKVIRSEYGQLPMGNQKLKYSSDPTYIYAGLYAGSARPSSGYAFQRIQSWAIQCADTLIKHQILMPPEKDMLVLKAMDDIFLSVLKSNPNASIGLFFNFFAKCKTSTVIRFLSDHATAMDNLYIIACMPKLLFLKELLTYFFKRWSDLKESSS